MVSVLSSVSDGCEGLKSTVSRTRLNVDERGGGGRLEEIAGRETTSLVVCAKSS